MYLYTKGWQAVAGFYLIFIGSYFINAKDSTNNKYNDKDNLVEVRAVFINCESDTDQNNPDSDITRFQRQELFKHNALRNCDKKLALTVKMATEPEAGWMEVDPSKDTSAGDEYIPIDHVFEGPNRKRVRLLNPYILRLRREPPKQAYKLRRIDTVSGILINENSKKLEGNVKIKKQVRTKRSADDNDSDEFSLMLGSAASVFTLEHNNPNRQSYSVKIGRLQEVASPPGPRQGTSGAVTKACSRLNTPQKGYVCPKVNNASLVRDKRYKQSISSIPATLARPQDYDENIAMKERHHQRFDGNREYRDREKDIFVNTSRNNKIRPAKIKGSRYMQTSDSDQYTTDNGEKERGHGENSEYASSKVKKQSEKEGRTSNTYDENNYEEKLKGSLPEKNFALYEIGNPDLWYTVKVQLFEKLSTPEGKTVWNDLTQGEQASVSSANPEWKGQDMNLRYRPTEWVPRDDFTLPMTSLCLLEPLRDPNYTSFDDESVPKADANLEYIVVPIQDVIGLEDINNLHKRDDNATSFNDDDSELNEGHHRVEIRVSRAIFGSKGSSFAIAALGDDRFLTLPHRRSHHAQIDLEVRADDNQLVRVGSSGRISTVVADNTRRTRTILSLQATNTGLASARFKAVAKECGPELSTLLGDKGSEEIATGPFLLPPQHTRRLHLEIPVEIPVDIAHCNVALVNDNDESVAVREVVIKKDDRCFCVWHCDCVCLSEDPKLICREMSQPQQVAAGLSVAEKPRRTRSACYSDDVVIDISGIVVGVLTLLLQLGLVKAVLGLYFRKIGNWGLDKILQMPRRLECYYESKLQKRMVVYDEKGWPVHPDTCARTVRVISWPMEFLLNVIMFIAIPCLLVVGLLKKALANCQNYARKASCKFCKDGDQVYNSQDMQSSSVELALRRKRRRSLREWMTPLAEELATDILQTGLLSQKLPRPPKPKKPCDDNELQPLLHETSLASKSGMLSAVDSEQDDTDYVLMQMQKSRESLARSQRKVNDSAISSDKNLTKGDNLPATSKQ